MSVAKSYLSLTLVLVLISLFLRLYHLSTAPPGLYVDDAAIGYNAYSLGSTGRDEYGEPFPVFLRSFGAYTPALVVYFAALPLKFFGPSVWSLRLTPVLLGAAAVIAFAILSARLFPRRPRLAFFLGGLLLALCPTHILFSRGFFESPLSLLLFLLGLVYLSGFRLGWGLLFLSLSSYAYHSQRLIIYLYLAGFVLLFYRRLCTMPKKKMLLYVLLFVLSQAPQLYLSAQPGPSKRFLDRTWIPDIRARSSSPVSLVLNSVREFSSQYISYYNPRNLFWSPDPDLQRSLPELSVYCPWLVGPFLIGLVSFIKKINRYRFMALIMLVAPVSASLTKDPFSVLRASLIILPVTLLILFGILRFLSSGFPFRRAILVCLFFSSLFTLYRSLFILLPNERYVDWTYGYQQAFRLAQKLSLPLLVDADKPVYHLYLFFAKISPAVVQSFTPRFRNYYSQTDWSDYYQTSRIRFAHIYWGRDVYISQIILARPLSISPAQAAEHYLTPEFTVYSPSERDPVLIAYRTHPDLKCLHSQVFNPLCP